jgi:endonuclease III
VPTRRKGTPELAPSASSPTEAPVAEPVEPLEPAEPLEVAIEVSVRATSIGRPRTPAGRAKLTAARLAREYPGTAKELCELDFSTPWQLLVATVLSAQTTDERVNSVTPALFSVYPDPPDLAGANPDDVEAIIRPTGFFRVKSRTVVALAVAVCDRFACEVPTALEDLVTLPGVGRKTGNVVRSVAFGLPGLPVDTHVGRISRLLMLTKQNDPEKVEAELTAMLPKREWGALSLRMILHGRRICIARRPRCPECVLADFCPSAVLPLGWTGPLRTAGPVKTGPASGASASGASASGASASGAAASGGAASSGPAAGKKARVSGSSRRSPAARAGD